MHTRGWLLHWGEQEGVGKREANAHKSTRMPAGCIESCSEVPWSPTESCGIHLEYCPTFLVSFAQTAKQQTNWLAAWINKLARFNCFHTLEFHFQSIVHLPPALNLTWHAAKCTEWSSQNVKSRSLWLVTSTGIHWGWQDCRGPGL